MALEQNCRIVVQCITDGGNLSKAKQNTRTSKSVHVHAHTHTHAHVHARDQEQNTTACESTQRHQVETQNVWHEEGGQEKPTK